MKVDSKEMVRFIINGASVIHPQFDLDQTTLVLPTLVSDTSLRGESRACLFCQWNNDNVIATDRFDAEPLPRGPRLDADMLIWRPFQDIKSSVCRFSTDESRLPLSSTRYQFIPCRTNWIFQFRIQNHSYWKDEIWSSDHARPDSRLATVFRRDYVTWLRTRSLHRSHDHPRFDLNQASLNDFHRSQCHFSRDICYDSRVRFYTRTLRDN